MDECYVEGGFVDASEGYKTKVAPHADGELRAIDVGYFGKVKISRYRRERMAVRSVEEEFERVS